MSARCIVRRDFGYVHRATLLPTEEVTHATASHIHKRCYESLCAAMRAPSEIIAPRKPVRFTLARANALQHLTTAAIALREDVRAHHRRRRAAAVARVNEHRPSNIYERIAVPSVRRPMIRMATTPSFVARDLPIYLYHHSSSRTQEWVRYSHSQRRIMSAGTKTSTIDCIRALVADAFKHLLVHSDDQ